MAATLGVFHARVLVQCLDREPLEVGTIDWDLTATEDEIGARILAVLRDNPAASSHIALDAVNRALAGEKVAVIVPHVADTAPTLRLLESLTPPTALRSTVRRADGDGHLRVAGGGIIRVLPQCRNIRGLTFDKVYLDEALTNTRTIEDAKYATASH